MSKRDYYEVLDVSKNASVADIKKAYRRLAMKHHPDRNTGDTAVEAEAQFKEVKSAYEILSDEQKRTAYDQFGHAGVDGNAGQGSGFGGAGFSDIFGDAFGDIFGGGRGGGQRANRGADLRYKLELSLEDAVKGSEVKIRVPTLVNCKICNGSGSKKGSKPKTCGTCHGAGQVRMQQGFFSVQQACPSCHGKGSIIADPCGTCHGQGRVQERKTLSVKVPAGVDTGDRIRLAGEGQAGEQGGPAGDLYVEMQVTKHPIFERDDADLYCEMPIPFTMAALGGELEVPTLEGKLKLKIPAGTQSNKIFRLRGKGVKPVRGGGVGDLMCRVLVETPVHLDDTQKDLLQQFAESLDKGGSKHKPKASSWVDGVKNFFEGMGF